MRRSGLLLLVCGGFSFGQSAAPAASLREVLTLEGRGAQIYTCSAKDGAAPAWTLTAPEAQLLDDAGQVVGHHGAGPVWRYKDGSAVHGMVVSKKDAPEERAIPWLVLRATEPEGTGVLSSVVEIRREETHGGAAPVSGCEVRLLGQETRVPYSARYRFFAVAGR